MPHSHTHTHAHIQTLTRVRRSVRVITPSENAHTRNIARAHTHILPSRSLSLLFLFRVRPRVFNIEYVVVKPPPACVRSSGTSVCALIYAARRGRRDGHCVCGGRGAASRRPLAARAVPSSVLPTCAAAPSDGRSPAPSRQTVGSRLDIYTRLAHSQNRI